MSVLAHNAGDPLTSTGTVQFNDFSTNCLGQLYNYIQGRLPLPAKTAAPVLTLVATDTGITYTITIAGSPPALVFTPTPDVKDIRDDFASVATLRAKVTTVAKLRVYGV